MNKALNSIYLRLFSSFVIIITALLTPATVFAADPIGTWSNSTSLPHTLASHISQVYNGRLHIVGGANTDVIPENIFSTFNADGSLQPWTSSNPSISLFWHSSAIKTNYIYLLGGASFSPNASLDSVYLGIINNNGTISNWTSLTSLPKALSQGASVVVGNKLYFAGGYTEGGSVNQDVYVATINADGTIGNWNIAGQLPEPLSGLGMVESGNNLIIVGGKDGNGVNSAKTYKTAINPNGTLAGWQQTSSLPQASYRGSVVRVGSTLFSIGGIANDIHNKVYYATINSDATISQWSTSINSLPQPICCGAAAANDDYLYMTGGYNGAYLNSVYYTKIDNSNDLNVPYFSQNVLPWGPSEYDHTKSLGVQGYATTMDRWGCAITSAAMVLNFHKMIQFADGKAINPGSLNEWLKSHGGYFYGYAKNGWYSSIDWNAIVTLSKELHKAGKAPYEFEFNPPNPATGTRALINKDLTEGNEFAKIPNILFVNNNGHFVVAKGIKDKTYTINDPEWNYPTLQSFNNTYSQVKRFVPSKTNSSYITLVVNPNVEILVTDSQKRRTGKVVKNGVVQEFNEIPYASYMFQPPIKNPNENGIVETLGTGVNEFSLPQPEDGTYTVTLSSKNTEIYTLNIATYESNGNKVHFKNVGTLTSGTQNLFTIQYSQTQQSSPKKSVTFANVIQDIKNAQKLRIINTGIAEALIADVREAEKQTPKHKDIAQKLLQGGISLLDKSHGHKEITSDEAYDILHYDFITLRGSIN